MVEKAKTGDVALATSEQTALFEESVSSTDSLNVYDFSLTTTFATSADNGAFDAFAPNQKTLLDLSMAFASGAAEGRVSGVSVADAFERASDIEEEKDESREFINHLIAESISESYTSTLWDSVKDAINATIEAGKNAMRKAQDSMKQIFSRREENVTLDLIKAGINEDTARETKDCLEKGIEVDDKIAIEENKIRACKAQLHGVTMPFDMSPYTAAGIGLYTARNSGLVLLDRQIVYNEGSKYFTLRSGQSIALTPSEKKHVTDQIGMGRSTAPFPARFNDPNGIDRLKHAQEYETSYNEVLKSSSDPRQASLIVEMEASTEALRELQEEKFRLAEQEEKLIEEIRTQTPGSETALKQAKADLKKIHDDKKIFESGIELQKEVLQAQTNAKNLLDQKDFRISLDQAYSFDTDDRRVISERKIAEIIRKADPSLSEKEIDSVSTEIIKILEKDNIRIKRDSDMEHKAVSTPSKRSAWTENFRTEHDLSIKKEFGGSVAPAVVPKNTLASSGSGKSPNEPDLTITGPDNV